MNKIAVRLKKMADNEQYINDEIKAELKQVIEEYVQECANDYVGNYDRINEYIQSDPYCGEPDYYPSIDIGDLFAEDDEELLETLHGRITDKFPDLVLNSATESFIDDTFRETKIDPAIVKEFDSGVDDVAKEIQENMEISSDPWRGTGMSQRDFI